MSVEYPAGLLLAKQLVYDKCGFTLANAVPEKESSEYDAHTFQLSDINILFRSAKITPAKTGQFVALWKRNGNGPIMPFDAADTIEIIVINTKTDNRFGQFVFPKSALIKHGVFTAYGKDGKRALRVYPPWDKTENTQAIKAQKWQLEYFLEINQDKPLDEARVKMLYKL